MTTGVFEIASPGGLVLGTLQGEEAIPPLPAFIAGPENHLLRQAWDQFLADPESPYNPLVLCGPTGCGKSHVAWLLAMEFQRRQPQAKALFISASDFARSLATHIDQNTMGRFRRRVRALDLLVIDGLEVLSTKPAAQQELIWTIDALLARGGRVAVVAKGAPQEIARLSPRLVNRLIGGLVTAIATPGVAARRKLLEQFAAQRRIRLPGAVAQVLAEGLPVNAPALQGALQTLAVRRANAGAALDVASARRFIEEEYRSRRPDLKEITQLTAQRFQLRVKDLRSPNRSRSIATARNLAILLSRQITRRSLAQLGDYFHRDHTTIMHSLTRAEALLQEDPALRRAHRELKRQLLGNG